MYKIEDLINFVQVETASENVSPDADLEFDIRITGDDYFELMEKYSKQFHVNLDGFLWYFHCDEEASQGIGGLLFSSPRKRVNHIPITLKVLLEYANKGFWDMKYPDHKLPRFRNNLIINQILMFLFLLFIFFFCYKKCMK